MDGVTGRNIWLGAVTDEMLRALSCVFGLRRIEGSIFWRLAGGCARLSVVEGTERGGGPVGAKEGLEWVAAPARASGEEIRETGVPATEAGRLAFPPGLSSAEPGTPCR